MKAKNAGKVINVKPRFYNFDKINLIFLSKPHAYLQVMTKTPVKFRKNWYKTVGGVAPTRYPLSIHIVIDNARKMAKFNLRKK